MKKLYPTLFSILCFFCYQIRGQSDCILGVGTTNDTLLSSVFQLNEEQREQLATFAEDIKNTKGLLNKKIENLKNKHPQSTVDELSELASKFKKLRDSMVIAQSIADKKMLAIFNEKQYFLYISLCKEAVRAPYIVVPKVYPDSLKAVMKE